MSGNFLAQLVGRCDVKILLKYRWAACIVHSISAHFYD